jgi:putative effector of murein hydrolase LrgA (UPF0299 family)
MLHALLTLIAFQLAGDLIADATSAPVPGMIIGLVLLLACLWLRGRVLGAGRDIPKQLNCVAKGLHDHFGLLFVPAGAGVMANADHLASDGTALLASVAISTLTTLAVTSLIVAGRRAERPFVTTQAVQ